jgi:hypothetical protein
MLIENPLNESSLAFPLLESVHIIGFIWGVGTIALVNFRLLGAVMTQQSSVQLWRDTMPWTLAGLSVALFSGLLLFSINPDVYYLNHVFVLKMAILVLAILFYYTAVYKATRSDADAAWTRVAGAVSLVLWSLVFAGGIFIGSIGAALNFKL